MKKLMFLLVLVFSSAANAALIQLSDSTGLTLSNDFETSVNNADITFDGTASRFASASATSSVTPSGEWGLLESRFDAPLTGTLSTHTTAVGFWFGNDDFGLVFDAILELFDGVTSLGSVSVTSNANDYADQFIGASSTVAFDSFQFTYQRPEAGGLSVYIDDVYLGSPSVSVPEPASLALFGLGLAGMGVFGNRRSRQQA